MKMWRLLLVLLVVLILLPACGGAAAPTAAVPTKAAVAPTAVAPTAAAPAPTTAAQAPTSAPVSKWTGAKFGGVVNLAMVAAPSTAETLTASSVAVQVLAVEMNESLVALGEDYKIVPMLAESWKVSDDGLTWTFSLRKGIIFHNGEEMTSQDVIASFTRFRKVSPRTSAFDIVTSVDAPDKYTVVFKVTTKTGTFLTNMASILPDFPIMPKSVILGADGQPKAANTLKIPGEIIGTGPYKLVQYSPDTVIVFKRHDQYQPLPGDPNGLGGNKTPYFDEVRINIVPDRSAQVAGLQSGAYDAILDIAETDFKQFRDRPDPNVKVLGVYPGQSYVTFFNHADKWTGNLKFRQAIAAGLDLEQVALFQTGGDKDMFKLNPYLWPKEGAMYLPNDPVAEAAYNQKNPEKAKQLLKEAGYNGEEVIYVTTRDYEPMYRDAVAIVDQLKTKMGMNAKVEVYDWAALNAKWESKTGWQFSGSSLSSFNYVPGVLRTYWYSTSTNNVRTFYSSPAMDKALVDGDTAITRAEQEAAYRSLQKVYWADLVQLKLNDTPSLSAWRTNLGGYTPWYRPRLFGTWRVK